MNSGFESGAPRDENYKGLQKGREKGGFLRRLRGVGRLGKPAIPVPPGLEKAMKSRLQDVEEEEKEETEEDFKQRPMLANVEGRKLERLTSEKR